MFRSSIVGPTMDANVSMFRSSIVGPAIYANVGTCRSSIVGPTMDANVGMFRSSIVGPTMHANVGTFPSSNNGPLIKCISAQHWLPILARPLRTSGPTMGQQSDVYWETQQRQCYLNSSNCGVIAFNYFDICRDSCKVPIF